MSSVTRTRNGFTLIEVLGALLVFSMGVLMTLNLTDGMSERLSRSALRSEVLVRARAHLDSIEASAGSGLSPSSVERSVTLQGRSYRETLSVSVFSPLVLEVRVTVEPASGPGPRETLTSFVSVPW